MRAPILLAASLVCFTFLLAIGAAHFQVRKFVYDIGTPTFARVSLPTAATAAQAMESHLHRGAGQAWLRQIVPNQGGALWIAAIVLVIAGFEGRRWSARMTDLLLAQAAAWLLFGTLDIFEETRAVEFLAWIRLLFEAVALVTAAVWIRTFWLQWRPYSRPWRTAAGPRTLAALATVLIVLNLIVVFTNEPDDSGYFANLGGQRLRDRGRLPYGDPMLTNTAGAAYPPLLYALHAASQVVIGVPATQPVEDRPTLGAASTYREPPHVATQLVLALSHLAGLAALWVLGRRAVGEAGAWALMALYAGSSYLLDVGGTRESVTGLTFVSHIVPASATLIAFACLPQPALSGALLAVAAGLGFYPAFFFPIWVAWWWRREPRGAVWFAGAFAVVCVAVGTWVLARSSAADGLTLVGTIVRDTLGHHSDPHGYGLSLYGLWGQQAGPLEWFGHPLVGTASWSTPFFVLFLGSLALAAWLAAGADLARVSLLTSGAAIGANLWKVHATATYVSWYYPFLLLGLLALSASRAGVNGWGPHGDEG